MFKKNTKCKYMCQIINFLRTKLDKIPKSRSYSLINVSSIDQALVINSVLVFINH